MLPESAILDALTAVPQNFLQAFVAGQSISAAARSSRHPDFAPTLLGPT